MSHDNRPSTDDTTSPESLGESKSKSYSLECGVCSFESFEYHPDEGVYRAIFDADVVDPTTAVVGAVSTVADTDPLDIEPLHSTIDPDALNTLFAGRRRGEGDIHVRFPVDGYSVTLSSYGSVVVRSSQSENSGSPVDAGE